MRLHPTSIALLVFAAGFVRAQEEAPPPPPRYEPKIAPTSDEAKLALTTVRAAEGFKVELVAAEPLLANPVAFWIDAPGRFYVAETFRQDKWGVADNRDHPEWMDDELRSRTVEDRRAMVLKHHPDYATAYTREHERIRLVVDEDGDGVCDRASVFADGFKDLVDGTGAGVLKRGRDLFFTCIPHLWRLRDLDGDGAADERTKLYSGFGARFALRGHDLHGLVLGQDGRLYFSIGDRGYSVARPHDTVLADPKSGAVFRCELDGSDLEVFATGLRNPQELAFDDYGNLFTVDNNSDSDDRARIVYVVEGGDCGWRMNFQYLPKRGPWVEEGWWRPRFDGQAAFLNPPIDNLGSGPSGLCANPGTGLPAKYDGWFFVCDFLGNRATSGVRGFKLEPEGAGFKLAETHHVVQGVLPTDCDFGPDGSLYVLDWVEGWVGAGKGRILRLPCAETAGSEIVRETAKLLARDLSQVEPKDLAPLLGHRDRRVRLNAQLELASRGPAVYPLLREVFESDPNRLARLHALWALGQGARRDDDAEALNGILRHVGDPDPEIRAQILRVVRDSGAPIPKGETAAALLRDPSPRVRYFAAMAGLANRGAWPIELFILESDARDPWLRHAAVQASMGKFEYPELDIADAAAKRSAVVRLCSVLALRRSRMAPTAFLDDADPAVAAEAARAIYDPPLPDGDEELAFALRTKAGARDWPFVRRALAANQQIGKLENAKAIALFARDSSASDEARVEALTILGEWNVARLRDRVLNDDRPRPAWPREDAVKALEPHIEALLRKAPPAVVAAAATTIARLRVVDAVPALDEAARDSGVLPRARATALDALAALDPARGGALAEALAADGEPLVRAAAAKILAGGDPERALPVIRKLLDASSLVERQTAYACLGAMRDDESERLIFAGFAEIAANRLPAEVCLDVVAAWRARRSSGSNDFKDMGEEIERQLFKREGDSRFALCLEGGDVAAGRRLFSENVEVACIRCHSISASDDPKLVRSGPPLLDVGKRRSRRELLEAILEPNRTIAEGFQTVILDTEEDGLVGGRVLAEDETTLTIETLDTGKPERKPIPKAQIRDRRSDRTAMPEDFGKKLSEFELRDLVAFLASLRG